MSIDDFRDPPEDEVQSEETRSLIRDTKYQRMDMVQNPDLDYQDFDADHPIAKGIRERARAREKDQNKASGQRPIAKIIEWLSKMRGAKSVTAPTIESNSEDRQGETKALVRDTKYQRMAIVQEPDLDYQEDRPRLWTLEEMRKSKKSSE